MADSLRLKDACELLLPASTSSSTLSSNKEEGITVDKVVASLKERFLNDQTYLAVHDRVLLSLNPFKISSNSDELHDYVQDYFALARDDPMQASPTSPVMSRSLSLSPHAWQIASKAYYHMRRTQMDQSIVISGIVGSGKTENRRLVLRMLLEMSSALPGKKGSRLSSQIPAAEFIMESLGHAAMLNSPNASRFGRYVECQFNQKGRLVGFKGLEYYLEKARVSSPTQGERNFHIFHYLLAGASPAERVSLQLDLAANGGKSSFRYLGSAITISSNISLAQQEQMDSHRFAQLKEAFKIVGLSNKVLLTTLAVLSGILHLGNLEFGTDKARQADSAVITNMACLEAAAQLLGVKADSLEAALTAKTVMIGKERCTFFLDPEAARHHTDQLASSLHGLLFSQINELINQKLATEEFDTFLAVLDFPGPQNAVHHREGNGLDTLAFNLANERIHQFSQANIFDKQKDMFSTEGIDGLPSLHTPVAQPNDESIRVLTYHPGGLVHIIDDQTQRRHKAKTDKTLLEALGKRWGQHANFGYNTTQSGGSFMCTHWHGQVTYNIEGFLDANSAELPIDFVLLFAGTSQDSKSGGSTNSLIRHLFATAVAATESKTIDAIVPQQPVKPLRKPSVRRSLPQLAGTTTSDRPGQRESLAEKDVFKPSADLAGRCMLGEFNASLNLLLETLQDTQVWFIQCLRPNESQQSDSADAKLIRSQIRNMGVVEIIKRLEYDWSVSIELRECWERYAATDLIVPLADETANLVWADKLRAVATRHDWNDQQMKVGRTKVFLDFDTFRQFEDMLRSQDEEEHRFYKDKYAAWNALGSSDAMPILSNDPYGPSASMASLSLSTSKLEQYDLSSSMALPLLPRRITHEKGGKNASSYDGLDDGYKFAFGVRDEEAGLGSAPGSTYSLSQLANGPDKSDEKALLDSAEADLAAEELRDTSSRRRWMMIVWTLTWWLPSPLIKLFSKRLRRRDVRTAFREKIAINMLIWLLMGIVVFVVAIMGNIICPTEHVYSGSELNSHSFISAVNNMLVAIRGEVFDLSSFAPRHYPSIVPLLSVQKYGGLDASNIFPVQVNALCTGYNGPISPFVTLDTTNVSDVNSHYHDFRAGTDLYQPDWYYEQMIYLRSNYRRGFMGFTPGSVAKMASTASTANVAIYRDYVYDFTNYVLNGGGGLKTPNGTVAPSDTDRLFMLPDIVSLFQTNSGQDITNALDAINVDSDVMDAQKVCMRNLFFIGKVDHRSSPQCQFSRYILLVFSVIMVAIIGFKFLAALQFGRSRAPEDHDKFVIMQVPCYTEGEDSLRACFESLAATRYDDKRKLIFVICDGMIVGSGNDRPTPRIVLDILGNSCKVDTEALSFQSLGEGNKQHNMGKVYSGLYEHAGHVVPYIVLVKVGKPNERSRPGNRGKRDSQMILMRFLNRVHFEAPMSPCELEIFHQIKNVIGVNPGFYEFLLAIDADTTVDKLCVNRFVSAMLHDKKVIAMCGETSLANAKKSFVTTMQVYEYFISHHMAKAFESLFGSVTCLPGCFSMYRLRTFEHKPLFVSNELVSAFGVNRVDTLHTKNLLHLGEDRYLTTIILTSFPSMKTTFCKDAFAKTLAPEDWPVFLSQRRRWINSTIHNLAELTAVQGGLCGFCCFSMRFVVFIDLISTLIQPVSVAYIVYLIYLVASKGNTVPTTALIMLAAIYGLQAVLLISKRAFEMVGMMIVYIIAIPVFSFILPIMSFWSMDDFSWGNTRIVMGEKGKRLVVHDEGVFDAASIPLKRWEEYEHELWDRGSAESRDMYKGDGYTSREASLYGGASQYGIPRSTSNLTGFDHQSFYGAPSLHNEHIRQISFDQVSLNSQVRRPGVMSGSVASALGAMSFSGGVPSQYQMADDIRELLATADLQTITKRGIRKELEARYEADLEEHKAFINLEIERALGY
ncbi:glycosyltransferase family 2 protein [Mixia osmundae IAM 14324]|uniref:chitin synthase n=1 Tax=Mixia osmundae (strain CBS 9802 / IAM 14324 / JCM 22182 / KY 12970) TaxID=764103 RepID=G7E6W2_MIXOS|nr:glycosyltransferase family 2 protein [Mixia osmundae IAM 14324]KEI39046.1 glycosyltransferase family 2 protein [Mixia osmundae IAM 14324]GAA98572.1 hypothetical protein E5Q_05259 [Mixia osmundae IAM 14324]